MCFKTKTPAAPAIRQAPRRDEQASAVQGERRRVREQAGSYGNVFTSALGDTSYGSNVATLGA